MRVMCVLGGECEGPGQGTCVRATQSRMHSTAVVRSIPPVTSCHPQEGDDCWERVYGVNMHQVWTCSAPGSCAPSRRMIAWISFVI